MRSRDAHVLHNLQIEHVLHNLEIACSISGFWEHAMQSDNLQCNLEIAQILGLHGTYILAKNIVYTYNSRGSSEIRIRSHMASGDTIIYKLCRHFSLWLANICMSAENMHTTLHTHSLKYWRKTNTAMHTSLALLTMFLAKLFMTYGIDNQTKHLVIVLIYTT